MLVSLLEILFSSNTGSLFHVLDLQDNPHVLVLICSSLYNISNSNLILLADAKE